MPPDQRFDELFGIEIESTKLEHDSEGRIRVLFDGEELQEINAWLKEELDRVYEDYQPLFANAVENLETVRAIKIQIPDSGQSVYPAPLARIPVRQITAAIYNDIVKPTPIFSIAAYLDAQLPVPSSQPAIPGQPAQVERVNTEDIAASLRRGYEFVARERIQFPQKIRRCIKRAASGCPYYWKVVARPTQVTKMAPRVNGATVDLDDKYEFTRMRGDIVQHDLVPYFNVIFPLDADGPNDAEWCAEREGGNRPDDIYKEFLAKELFLIESEEQAKMLMQSTVDLFNPHQAKAAASIEKKTPQKPTQVCDRWLVWFPWTVRYKDPQSEQVKIKKLNLLGSFHKTCGQLMNCFMHPYDHQERPYELIDQDDEGACTAEDMKYHQTMFTYLGQAEIKNAFHANNMTRWFDGDNITLSDFFTANRVIGPGDNVPGIFEKEWGYARAGVGHYSLLQLMQFILTMSQLDSKQSKYSSGDPGGRTPANTMRMALQQAGQEPDLFLHRLSDKLSRMLRLDMEIRRQYQPLGETIQIWDAEQKRMADIAFRFPVGDVLDYFRIALTASDDALSQEIDPQQIMSEKNAIMQDGEYVAKVIEPLLNVQTPLPESAVKLFAKIVSRDQKLLRKLVGRTLTDEGDFDLTPELQALIAERNAKIQEMAQAPPPTAKQEPPRISIALSGKLSPDQEASAAQMAGIGGMNAQGQAPQSGGVVPGQPPAGNGGRPVQPGGQPVVPPHPPSPPMQGGPVPPGAPVQ